MAAPTDLDTPNYAAERARVAALTRCREADDPELVAARTRMESAWLEAAVAKALAKAPPLTEEQRVRLAALLAPAPVVHNRKERKASAGVA